MILLLAASSALATGGTPPTQRILWPERSTPVPRDVVLHVLDEVEGQGDPTLTTVAGDPVIFTTHPWTTVDGLTWRMLAPDQELAPGEYTLSAGYDAVTFVVEDRLAELAGPPGPYRRWRATGCEDGDALSYRVCGGGVVHLVATGGPPGEPALDAPGDARVGSVGEDRLELPVAQGWPTEVWIGDLDEAGRFTGWWGPDLVEPTDDGVRVSEAPEGSTASPGYTMSSVAECPADAPWEVFEEDDCSPTELVTRTEGGCGCGPAGGPGATVGLVLAASVNARGSARSRRCSRRPG